MLENYHRGRRKVHEIEVERGCILHRFGNGELELTDKRSAAMQRPWIDRPQRYAMQQGKPFSVTIPSGSSARIGTRPWRYKVKRLLNRIAHFFGYEIRKIEPPIPPAMVRLLDPAEAGPKFDVDVGMT